MQRQPHCLAAVRSVRWIDYPHHYHHRLVFNRKITRSVVRNFRYEVDIYA